MIHESHHGKLRETEASKQYQGIQLVLVVTTNLLDNSAQQSCLDKAILIHKKCLQTICLHDKYKPKYIYKKKHFTFLCI